MALSFCSFASGSSGNSYLIKGEQASLLLDCGIAGRDVANGLLACGVEPQDVAGIFITHEHTDHIKSLKTVTRMTGAPCYSTPGTLGAVKDRILTRGIEVARYGAEIQIGDVTVRSFPLAHDAMEPVGFSFTGSGKRVTVITDTGCVTEAIYETAVESDLLVLEANHERNVLLMGRYPYRLKMRILGDHGHISNEQAAQFIARILKNRKNPEPPTIALAHLSQENNTPEMAYLTVRNILFDEGFYEKKDYWMTVLTRNERSRLITI